MIPASQLTDYLREQALNLDLTELQIAVMTLQAVIAVAKPKPSRDLYRYRVPKLGEGGSCSLIDELDETPYDLRVILGVETAETTAGLANLYALLDSVNAKIGADWLGIYRRIGAGSSGVLVKLAYKGVESRAEFPLTEEFAAVSNNSRVGLTGWAVLVDDVATWREEGGGYYECDPKVKSEVCLPVLNSDDNVLGIIDAESFEPGYFTPERLVWLAALAIVLPQLLVTLPPLETAASAPN
ncbi:GAF domain-containing protein [Chromobacterium sp. IIBBL 290-4]|uniref:GAF domain-containing protein n=1 Tax=Chromobacterium sp. IIBBL 290-4 TaxID=2953890 RepID=UPI0020B8F093|nr:hypothetical protein [Chromobacterium sp. IIBBL 290-4]UTH73491.1 hypothetical protein NKT35_18400 [Chromobacterium sp. IIBBL 290-4]